MAKKLDLILVIDLEATCWDGPVPAGQSPEIIEIGLCLWDLQQAEIAGSESILVKPEQSEISEFCTQLTTLKASDLEAGLSLREACRHLEKTYLSAQRTWASWGAYDLRQLQRECQAKKIRFPMSPEHLNLKSWFALKYRLQQTLGMDQALQQLGLELEGTHHRGVDDARNIARILGRLLDV